MTETKPIKIEMFYSLSCPNCRTLKHLLKEILPEFEDKFELKTTLANSPKGIVKTMKLGIHSVPTLLIDENIIYREVPSKKELIEKLKTY